jgi:hypothetical protein
VRKISAGKYLAIVAALLTILGSYLFAMYEGLAPDSVASAIGLFQGITTTFENVSSYSAALGGEWVAYTLIILMIIFAISGIFQLIGIKSRAVILIFSLFPLGIGIIAVLDILMSLDSAQINYMLILLTEKPIIEGAIPFYLDLGGVGLGSYLVIAGGFIGIISGILPREEYY